MTPLERAEKIEKMYYWVSRRSEVEKRRAVETAVTELEDALMLFAQMAIEWHGERGPVEHHDRALALLRKRGRL